MKYNCCFHRYILESDHIKKFFKSIQDPSFDIASDAASTFRVKYHDPLHVLSSRKFIKGYSNDISDTLIK